MFALRREVVRSARQLKPVANRSTRRYASEKAGDHGHHAADHGHHEAPKSESLGVCPPPIRVSNILLTSTLDSILRYSRHHPSIPRSVRRSQTLEGWQDPRPLKSHHHILRRQGK